MLKFKCLFCEKCCYFEDEEEMPVVFEDEVQRLRSLRGDLEFIPLGDGRYRWIIRGFCPFFDREEHRCRIHQIKPTSCKIYPLILMGDGSLAVSEECEWVKEHPEVKEMELRELLMVFEDEFRALFRRLLGFVNK